MTDPAAAPRDEDLFAPFGDLPRPAMESAIQFIETSVATKRCDSEAVADCVRCNAVAVARWLKTAIEALAALAAARLALHQENEELKKRLEWDTVTGQLERCRKTHRDNLARLEPDTEPGLYQWEWRKHPPFYRQDRGELAVVDALIEQGSIAAWHGDGVSCVAQMIDAQAQRADAAEAALTQLRQDLAALPRYTVGYDIAEDDGGVLVGEIDPDGGWIKARDLADRLARLPQTDDDEKKT